MNMNNALAQLAAAYNHMIIAVGVSDTNDAVNLVAMGG